MKRVVTASLMKNLDRHTIEGHYMPSLVLMERAALAVVEELAAFDLRRTLVVCGGGNNAGDGIAVARLLTLRGYEVDVWQIGEEGHKTKDCVLQEKTAASYFVTWINNPSISEYTTIVDAIFGVGLSREVKGIWRDAIEAVNRAPAKVMAVDIPSGIHADTGQVMGCAVEADVTVAFGFAKAGELLYPGADYCGRLAVCDIGIPWEEGAKGQALYHMEKSDLALIPRRSSGGNKGSFGKVFLVAGSPDMAGAAYLSALAAFRTGCGMVKIAVPLENRDIMQKLIPEAMLSSYNNEEEAFAVIQKGLNWADVAGIGPGMGQGDCAEKITRYFFEHNTLPAVIDADALNFLSKNVLWLKKRTFPCILTPHVGEMARLTGREIARIKENLPEAARGFSAAYRVQCVLKDAATCIGVCDGPVYINTTGNCGMATAGSGDVLTGILLGLLAQGTPFSMAGALGCHLHGMLGDMAAEKHGTAYVMAGDLIRELDKLRIGDNKGERYEKI